MLSRAALREYVGTLDMLSDEAAAQVETLITAYVEANPGASVAEIRDYAAGVVLEVDGMFSTAASVQAANLYDNQLIGADVPNAQVIDGDAAAHVEKEAHYQAGKLANGDFAGFAQAMGRFAADQPRRTANRTITENAERAGSRIRYARVPLGIETCEFCNMLASRGFVYHSTQTAGEFTKYHPGCRCAVVPGYAENDVIEGYAPGQYEALNKVYADIDRNPNLTPAQKQQAKQALTEYNAAQYKAGYDDLGGKERWYAPIENSGANQVTRWQAGDTRSNQRVDRGTHRPTGGNRTSGGGYRLKPRSALAASDFDTQQHVWEYTARAAAFNPDERESELRFIRRMCSESGHPEWGDGIEDLWDATAPQVTRIDSAPVPRLTPRQQLEADARRVYMENAPGELGISADEAARRFDLQVGSNTDAQLRRYINRRS